MTWGINPKTGEIWRDSTVITTVDLSDGVSIPDDVLTVMADEYRLATGDDADDILMSMVCRDIVEGPVPESE